MRPHIALVLLVSAFILLIGFYAGSSLVRESTTAVITPPDQPPPFVVVPEIASGDSAADMQVVACSMKPLTDAVSQATPAATPLPPTAPPAPLGLDAVKLPWRDDYVDRWKLKKYFCPGDFNRDDKIDQLDVDMFMETWSSGQGPLAEFLDVNGDGEVDFNDVDAFINAYEAGGCDPVKTAENRAIAC